MLNFFLALVAVVFSPLFLAQECFAFPEMIRAGYPNCIACHASPNGGGILSPYGRQSSATVLSTWGSEKEALPFYKLYPQPENLDSQAYFRGVQTALNNSRLVYGGEVWI